METSFHSFYQKRLQQIFLYITHDCNFSCRHCLVGDRSKSSSYKLESIKKIFEQTNRLGAQKVTVLGGEPTQHGELLEIIAEAKIQGFSVVLDTNGSFETTLFQNELFKKVDTLCFSVDGHDAKTHDTIRGKGSFALVVDRIQTAKNLGIRVKISHTVTNANLKSVFEMISFAEENGINELNFHVATINGRAKLVNDPNVVSPKDWHDTYKMIRYYVMNKALDGLILRIPPRYCTINELATIYYDHSCIGVLADRMLILPCDTSKNEKGGPLYVCGLLVGEDSCIGWNIDGEFIFNQYDTGEFAKYYAEELLAINNIPICPIISDKSNPNYLYDESLFPLCISYKPPIPLINDRATTRCK